MSVGLEQLSRAILRTKLIIAFEHFARLIQPLIAVLLTFLAISWFGLWQSLPQWLHLSGVTVFSLCFIACIWPLRALHWPSEKQAIQRLEISSNAQHQSLSLQSQKLPEKSDDIAQILFEEHQRRQWRQWQKLSNLSIGPSNAGLAKRDPWALRTVPILLAIIAFVFGYGQHFSRLNAAIQFDGLWGQKQEIRADIWLTPPQYTSLPPMLLSKSQSNISAPAGSQLFVQLAGTNRSARLKIKSDQDEQAFDIAPNSQGENSQSSASKESNFKLFQSAEITLTYRSEEIFTGFVEITPDEKPQINWEQFPTPQENGAFTFSYRVNDDHAAKKAYALISPIGENFNSAKALMPAPKLKLTLPRSRQAQALSTSSQNLTDHPLAGERVKITLFVEDALEQIGNSETIEFTLPKRRFNDPLAKALVSTRQKLAADKMNKRRSLDILDALMSSPELHFDNKTTAFIAMSATKRRLINTQNDDDLRSAIVLLWQTALGIEDGNVSLASEQLRQARQKLSDALEQGASDEEIAALVEELREAMDDFVKAMQAQSQQFQTENQLAQQDPNSLGVTPDELNKMLDQIQEMAQSGAQDAARQLLDQLQNLMDNMQTAQQSDQNSEPSEQDTRLNELMNQLGDILAEQQSLRDQTFEHSQEHAEAVQKQRREKRSADRDWLKQNPDKPPSQLGQREPSQAETELSEQLDQLAEKFSDIEQAQKDLQQKLREARQGLQELGLESEEGFLDADQAMGDAQKRLGQEQYSSAQGEQARAIQALRKGAQSLAQQLSQMAQSAQNQGNAGNGSPNQQSGQSGRDPLGRNRIDQNSKNVPTKGDVKQSREIQDQIRQRLEDNSLTRKERRYLEDLLRKY